MCQGLRRWGSFSVQLSCIFTSNSRFFRFLQWLLILVIIVTSDNHTVSVHTPSLKCVNGLYLPDLEEKVLYDYGFVNMYMFTTTLVLFIYSVFVQGFFFLSFLRVMIGGLVYSHMLAKGEQSLPWSAPWSLFLRLRWSVYQQGEKKTSMEMNKPIFLFASSLHKSLFLLLVIYSNDQDIKQCFVGKSPPEFYGLWHIIKETSS